MLARRADVYSGVAHCKARHPSNICKGCVTAFYIVFSCVVPVGCLMKLCFVWNFSDLANGLMAIPNLIALLLLSPVVFKLI